MAGRMLMLLLLALAPLVWSDNCHESGECDRLPQLLRRLTGVTSGATQQEQHCMCGSADTCCSLLNGSASCCPLPNAICCPGGSACCPAGEACALDSCFGGIRPWPFIGYKGPARKTSLITGGGSEDGYWAESEKEVQFRGETECPDKTVCQINSTCCPASSSGYSCCPMNNAVCCSDQVHCCPSNTICSSNSDECLQIEMTVIGHNTSIRIEMFPPSSSYPSSSTSFYSYFPSSFLWLPLLIPPSLSSSSMSSCASSFLTLLLPLCTHLYYGSGAS